MSGVWGGVGKREYIGRGGRSLVSVFVLPRRPEDRHPEVEKEAPATRQSHPNSARPWTFGFVAKICEHSFFLEKSEP